MFYVLSSDHWLVYETGEGKSVRSTEKAMDAIAFGVLTLLLLVMLLAMLLVGGILRLTAYLFKSRASRESGVGMRASDFVYGAVVPAIWVLSWAGLLGWFSGPFTSTTAEALRFNIAFGLPWLAVTSYMVVALAVRGAQLPPRHVGGLPRGQALARSRGAASRRG